MKKNTLPINENFNPVYLLFFFLFVFDFFFIFYYCKYISLYEKKKYFYYIIEYVKIIFKVFHKFWSRFFCCYKTVTIYS